MNNTLPETQIITYTPEEARHRRGKSYSKACEVCYFRKVRCPLGSNGGPCENCVKHGHVCRPRVRRHKRDSRPETSGHQRLGNAGKTTTSRANSPQTTTPQANISQELTETSLRLTGDNAADNSGEASLANQALFVDRRCHELRRPQTPSSASHDMFKGSAFLSRFAILGDDFPGIDLAHKDEGVLSFNISPLDLQTLQIHGAFELPDMALRQSLVDAFFEWCWAWSPVLEHSETDMQTKHSLVVLQAVLLAGSVMRPKVCSEEMVGTLYRRVKALIHARYEDHPLMHVASIILLQWHTPTPPKDVTTDLPRFWMTYALGLAQQIGLHREPTYDDCDRNLRRRIWWAIYVCDCFSAAAEGRPRLINLEDCSVSPPTVHDFPRESEFTALVFMSFVAIAGILSDTCQVLVRRREICRTDRMRIENRLKTYIRDFPDQLRLYNSSNRGSYRPFNLQAAQLHIHFLTTIVILYRPKSLFFQSEENIPSFVAAGLCLEIFEAIHLRELTPYLATIFSWNILVAAVAQISWSRIPGLREQCNAALDSVENILGTFASSRPAAANNLRNIRAIRRAVMNRETPVPTQMPTPISHVEAEEALGATMSSNASRSSIPDVLEWYGPKMASDFARILQTFRRHCALQGGRTAGRLPEQSDAAGQEYSQNQEVGDGEAAQPTDGSLHYEMDDSNALADGINISISEELRNDIWMRDLVEELEMVYDVVM